MPARGYFNRLNNPRIHSALGYLTPYEYKQNSLKKLFSLLLIIHKCNESKVANLVNRKFNEQPILNVVISDLTYVRVGLSWNYICIMIDLHNRKLLDTAQERTKITYLYQRHCYGRNQLK